MPGHPLHAPEALGPFPQPVLDQVAAELEAAAAAREKQLADLPAVSPAAVTPVAAAHRRSVRRILDAIRSAQAQLAAGTYGDCHRCGRRAEPTTDLTRPWAPACASCNRR